MRELVLVFDVEETLLIDDYEDATMPAAVAPPEAVKYESGMESSFQAAKDALIDGRRMVV